MMRKVKKMIGEYGRSLAANCFRPGTLPSRLWVRIREPANGISSL